MFVNKMSKHIKHLFISVIIRDLLKIHLMIFLPSDMSTLILLPDD